jgi:cbb3-type cytochrome oxidase maturation protein
MTIIILLIFISLIIAVGFLLAFLWSMKSGQFDDTYSPSVRMLFDDKVKSDVAVAKSDERKQIQPEKESTSGLSPQQ